MEKELRKNKLNREAGISTADALIAIGIIALFAGIIATLSYNMHLATVSTNRISRATHYIVSMFEYVEKTDFPDGIDNDEFTGDLVGRFRQMFEEDITADGRPPLTSVNEPNAETPFSVTIAVELFETQRRQSTSRFNKRNYNDSRIYGRK